MAAPVSTLGTAALLLPPRYRRHAKKIAIGIVIGSAVLVAIVATYSVHRSKQVSAINSEFSAMKSAIFEGDLDVATKHFEFIKDKGGDFQINMATLHMAYGHFEKGEYDAAAKLYEEIIASAETKAMKDVARLRFAKVLLTQGKTQEALDLLLTTESATIYLTLLTETLSGDIYLVENDLVEASAAYAKALQSAVELGDTDYQEVLETRRSMAVSLMLQQGIAGQVSDEQIDKVLVLEQANESFGQEQ